MKLAKSACRSVLTDQHLQFILMIESTHLELQFNLILSQKKISSFSLIHQLKRIVEFINQKY